MWFQVRAISPFLVHGVLGMKSEVRLLQVNLVMETLIWIVVVWVLSFLVLNGVLLKSEVRLLKANWVKDILGLAGPKGDMEA